MLNGARLRPNLRHGLCTECASCATTEENILLSDKSPVPPYRLFFGMDAPLSKNLRGLSWIIVAPLVSLLDILTLMKFMYFASTIR